MQSQLKHAVIAAFAFTIFGCDTEPNIKDPGTLVPRTVMEDASIPSININGTTIHVESYGDPSDPILIFLHGGPGGDYRNAVQITDLTTDGYYVIFYDQRGSGLSQRHDEKTYSIQLMLDDLTELITYYRTDVDQKVYLFGHSWGAMLAAAYINEYPEGIEGAIFAEPGGLNKSLLDEYGEESRELNLFSEETNDVLYYDQFITGGENDHEILDYKLGLATTYYHSSDNIEGIEGPSPFWRNGAVVLNAFVDISEDEGFDFTTHLDQYHHAVLFIYGENNQAYGKEFAEKEASYFNEWQAVEIPDTGHEMIYFQWDEVYPVVLNYLQSN